MAEEYTKITNEEVERAFREAAVFLFGLYKKYKQNKQMEQDDAAWQFVYFFHNNIIKLEGILWNPKQ